MTLLRVQTWLNELYQSDKWLPSAAKISAATDGADFYLEYAILMLKNYCIVTTFLEFL